MKNLKNIKSWLRQNGADVSLLDENGVYSGYLDLRSVTSLPEGFNPTVGGYLDLRSGCKYIGAEASIPSSLHWKWRDKYYIKVDGIFQQVVSHRGNVYRVKNIGAKDVTYLVTDGNGRWSHGKNLKEAREDLIYKISDRDTSKYKGLTLDSVLTKADAIQCYRVITGACAAGTRGFCKTLGKMKSKYSIREIIELTAGQYGHDAFANFFNR